MSRRPYSFFIQFDDARTGGELHQRFPQGELLEARLVRLSGAIKASGFATRRGFYSLRVPEEERMDAKEYARCRIGGKKLPHCSASLWNTVGCLVRAEASKAVGAVGGLEEEEAIWETPATPQDEKSEKDEKDGKGEPVGASAMSMGKAKEACFKHEALRQLRELGFTRGVLTAKRHAHCDHALEGKAWDWLLERGFLPVGFEVPVGLSGLRLKESFDHDVALSGRMDVLCVDRDGGYVIIDVKTRASGTSAAVTVLDVYQLYVYALLWGAMHPDAEVAHLLIVCVCPATRSLSIHRVRWVGHLAAAPLFKQRSAGLINYGQGCDERVRAAMEASVERLGRSMRGVGEERGVGRGRDGDGVGVKEGEGDEGEDAQVHDGAEEAADGRHAQARQQQLDEAGEAHAADEDAQDEHCVVA